MDEAAHLLLDQLRAGLSGPLGALSGEPPIWELVAEQLAREVAATAKQDSSGRAFSPDQFTISLHTLDARTLAGNIPNIQDVLARALHTALTGSRYSVARFPHVTLSADPTLRLGEARAIAWHSRDPISFAAQLASPADEDLIPPAAGAFLIVDGKRHFRLDRPLINLGRKLDNHLVLPDPHISRRHAEIRMQGGRFMLRDLNSTAGTRVNGQLISEHLLQPGDVITIAGFTLIYGEDPGGPPDRLRRYTPPSLGPKDPNQVTPLDMRRSELFPGQSSSEGADRASSQGRSASDALPTRPEGPEDKG
jgi:hypothetical protein